VDLDTYIGHTTHLKKWSFFHRTPYPKVLCWLQVDFTPLQDLCLGYKQQDHIDPYPVEMASTAMIHFGLDPGKFVRFFWVNTPANIGTFVVP
jgi:hypothetical protein